MCTFLQPTFYDGQGMMVAADSGITDLDGLVGGVVCAAGGTTTEGNIATEFARLGLAPPEVLSFDDVDLIQQAFQEGRCDGWSSDRSQLTGLRSTYPDGPEALTILRGDVLQGAARPGRARRRLAVGPGRASGRSSPRSRPRSSSSPQANVDAERDSDQTPTSSASSANEVEGAVLDPGLGLPPDFAVQVVSQVGNYGEIYDAHITPLGLDRGTNALWSDGGLLYAPPYR